MLLENRSRLWQKIPLERILPSRRFMLFEILKKVLIQSAKLFLIEKEVRIQQCNQWEIQNRHK